MTKFGCPAGGVEALLQFWSAPPSSPGIRVLSIGFLISVSGLPCSTCRSVVAAAFAFGTWRPALGSGGYICACSIQFCQTTNGYCVSFTGQVAATHNCHAVCAMFALIAVGAAQGLSTLASPVPAFATEIPIESCCPSGILAVTSVAIATSDAITTAARRVMGFLPSGENQTEESDAP